MGWKKTKGCRKRGINAGVWLKNTPWLLENLAHASIHHDNFPNNIIYIHWPLAMKTTPVDLLSLPIPWHQFPRFSAQLQNKKFSAWSHSSHFHFYLPPLPRSIRQTLGNSWLFRTTIHTSCLDWDRNLQGNPEFGEKYLIFKCRFPSSYVYGWNRGISGRILPGAVNSHKVIRNARIFSLEWELQLECKW